MGVVFQIESNRVILISAIVDLKCGCFSSLLAYMLYIAAILLWNVFLTNAARIGKKNILFIMLKC